jgi:YHS domain-containing protein
MEHLDPVWWDDGRPGNRGRPRIEFEGRSYYFCHPGCRARFAADPQFFSTEGRRSQPMMPVVQLRGRASAHRPRLGRTLSWSSIRSVG